MIIDNSDKIFFNVNFVAKDCGKVIEGAISGDFWI